MPNLEQLAARVEAAEGASRELFEEAFDACFPRPDRIWITDNTSNWTEEYIAWFERMCKFNGFLDAGAWTDAAMMIVPEGDGIGWQVSRPGDAGVWRVPTNPDDYDTNRFPVPLWVANGNAATPALALCAAAIRARMEER